MAVKNSKKRKFDVKDFIIVILTFSTVFAIIYSLRRGPKQEFENTSPVISQQEEKKSSHEEQLTDMVALPQFAFVSLEADVREQSLTFENPSRNTVQFRVSIILNDDELLWQSEFIKPGELSQPVILTRTLSTGVYEKAVLKYECFTNDSEKKQLNGAESPIKLVVN